MSGIADANITYSRIIGIVIALIGIIGFFNNPVFGILGVNMASNIVHLLGGLLIAWKPGKGTNNILGWTALVAGVMGFIPTVSVITNSWLGYNTPSNVLHIAIGLASLGIAKWAE